MPNLIASTSSQILADVEEMCMTVKHPNICPIWFLRSSIEPAIVTPWFSNGNVADFVQKDAGIDKLGIVRLITFCFISLHRLHPALQVKQIANAIVHIHAMGEVHGNILPVSYFQ